MSTKSKKTEQPEVEAAKVETPSATPTFPVILRASSPEELAEKLNNLTAPEGRTLYAGCIGRDKDDGSYTLRVDIQ
jgi:hypothetical protein